MRFRILGFASAALAAVLLAAPAVDAADGKSPQRDLQFRDPQSHVSEADPGRCRRRL